MIYKQIADLAEKTGRGFREIESRIDDKTDEIIEAQNYDMPRSDVIPHSLKVVRNDLLSMTDDPRKRHQRSMEQREKFREKVMGNCVDEIPDVDDSVWQKKREENSDLPIVRAKSKDGKIYPVIVPSELSPLKFDSGWIEITFEPDTDFPVVVSESVSAPWKDGRWVDDL